jgi:hypothetical protein
MLRVYDKREEMRQLREDVTNFLNILTRLEWQLRLTFAVERDLIEKHPLTHFRMLPEEATA